MTYRLLLCLCACLVFFAQASAQPKFEDPVHWEAEAQPLGNGEFNVLFNAKIDAGWWVYSQFIEGDGPVPTSISFADCPDVKLIGKVEELGDAEKKMDPNFEMELIKFHDRVTFRAKVKINKPKAFCKAKVEYMTCNNTKCLPPDYQEFPITFESQAVETPKPPKDEIEQNRVTPPVTPNSGKTVFNNNKPGTAQNTNSQANAGSNGKPVLNSPNTPNNANGATNSPTNEVNTAKNAIDNSGTTATLTTETTSNDNKNTDVGNGLQGMAGNGNFPNPVKWTFEVEPLSNGEYYLNAKAIAEQGWYIYAQNLAEGGPEPTLFSFDNNADIELLGTPEEISTHKKEGFDKLFNMNIVKYAEEVLFRQKVRLKNTGSELKGQVRFMTCDDTKCLPSELMPFAVAVGDVSSVAGTATAAQANTTPVSSQSGRSPWAIFFLGFLGGLVALFTPCVFPMIPVTVSFFTKRSKDRKTGIRNAWLYALSIIGIYVAIGLLITVLFGATALNELSTNPWVNIAFFVIFLFFAFSFFGFYEITLPSWLVNKSDEAADRGGLLGIFFMAFTLSLTSFSCTGPIIGSLLVEAASGGIVGPALGMTGFALALALPFALLAAFPSWLNSLPKSGGWLNSVKVVLGFIEIALAFKFLSNADLVKQWGLLKREVFLGIWAILSILTAIYLLGKIKFPHDSPVKKLSPARIGLAVLFALFGLYMAYGIPCKELAIVSGFPPPITYSYGCAAKSHCPHGLNCYHDYAEGLAAARQQNKPIFVDFTGWACVNCRKMESSVWGLPAVLPKLQKDYVLISLYVDEKVDLPAGEQVQYTDYKGRQKTMKTVGDKWLNFETTCFKYVAQPWYVLLDPQTEDMLVGEAVGYTSAETFNSYLEKGLDNFKKGITEVKLDCKKDLSMRR